ncbi:hypothetical protein [Wolbachia endosymbiont of Tribolium confusum]|uniref:hypothetical protein n=1 Tax=Wolbachia endosymbiont of Tribolium confusum TaxID=214474 RepID=UPI001CF499C9|nr:hypothetical protein [Wolbachia endosymbiont of Tribolium confusum]MCA7010182.1 hypothetical protein [Wolbachia endosymbiont of Tribolium confusum]
MDSSVKHWNDIMEAVMTRKEALERNGCHALIFNVLYSCALRTGMTLWELRYKKRSTGFTCI